MSTSERWLWLGVLLMLLVTVAVVARERGPSVRIEGGWVLDRVQTASLDQTLHGPDDFRPGLGIGPSRAYVDQGCGGFLFDVANDADRLDFDLREQDRSYGPCSTTDATPGRWDSWLPRVDHAERHGSQLVLSGAGVRLLWHPAPPPPPPDPDAAPLDGAWTVVSIRIGERSLTPSPLRPPVLGLDSFSAEVDTRCSTRYVGWDATSYHQIRMKLAPLEGEACRSALRPQERALLHGLRGARRFTLTARRMQLSGRTTLVTFRRLPSLQLERLDDTRWRLVSLVDGSITTPPRRLRAAPTGPQVRFSVAGAVMKVNRGCRSTESGFGLDAEGRIMALDKRESCRFDTRLDRYLTRVYASPWWFEIVGDTMHVQGYSGRGLIYQRVGDPQ